MIFCINCLEKDQGKMVYTSIVWFYSLDLKISSRCKKLKEKKLTNAKKACYYTFSFFGKKLDFFYFVKLKIWEVLHSFILFCSVSLLCFMRFTYYFQGHKTPACQRWDANSWRKQRKSFCWETFHCPTEHDAETLARVSPCWPWQANQHAWRGRWIGLAAPMCL